MVCNKAPRNDGITSEFYEAFSSELKTSLSLSYQKFFCLENWSFFKNKKLLSSLTKDKDKRVTGKLPPRRLSPTNPTSRLRFGSGAILWGWGRGGQSFRGQFSKYPNDQMLEANFSAYVDKRFRIKDQRFAVNGRYRKCFWYCWPTILINVQKIFGFEKTYYV